jgi:hypothetical protein
MATSSPREEGPVNGGEPPPGVLFALAVTALLAAICAVPVLAAWWLL